MHIQQSMEVAANRRNANEVKLRKPKIARPVARDEGDFFGFGGQADARSGGNRRSQGGTFNWLFR